MNNPITIQTTVNAPLEKVWECWTRPEHINNWAFASDDWEARDSKNDVKKGGKFKTIMAAKDGTTEFAFEGIYTAVKKHSLLEYDMTDKRHVRIEFENTSEGVKVTETFDPEDENSLNVQKDGWQQILNNFKKYTEEVNVKWQNT